MRGFSHALKSVDNALVWAVATSFGADFSDHRAATTGGMVVSLWLVVLSFGLIGSIAGLIFGWIERNQTEE